MNNLAKVKFLNSAIRSALNASDFSFKNNYKIYKIYKISKIKS